MFFWNIIIFLMLYRLRRLYRLLCFNRFRLVLYLVIILFLCFLTVFYQSIFVIFICQLVGLLLFIITLLNSLALYLPLVRRKVSLCFQSVHICFVRSVNR